MKVPSFKIDLSQRMKQKIVANINMILDSGMFSSGEFTKACEEKVKQIAGAKFAFMTASGSAALETCASVLKKEHGLGKVLIPNNTFIATALAFEKAGFTIDFYNNGFNNLSWEEGELSNNYKGVVIVELGGFIPENIKDFIDSCHKKGLWVCEDSAHAFGSTLGGKQAGTFADIAAFSFFATKVVTSGEGGAVITNNPIYAREIEMFRDFGRLNPWASYHYSKGWNCRMNEFEAAVLLPQLDNHEEIINSRQKIVRIYAKKLEKSKGLRFLGYPSVIEKPNGYKVIAFIEPSLVNREKFLQICAEKNVKFQGKVYEYSLTEQPPYWGKRAVMGIYDEPFFSTNMICLPSWYGMKEEEIDYIVKIIQEALQEVAIEK